MKITVYILICILLILLTQITLSGKQGNPHGDIKFDCIECHSAESWQFKKNNASFDHGKTGFPLIGGHNYTDCLACHENLVFNYIGTTCIDCHTDIHKNELGVNCENCHTPQNWDNRQEILKEHNFTQFPLIGVHAVVECEACHINQQRNEYKNTPVECEYCHQQAYKATLNPNHQLAQFTLDCIECHQVVPTTWNKVNWQHPQSFELKGAHKNADCAECHANTFEGTSSQCIACHRSEYQSVSFPDHANAGYPEDCTLCHDEQQWQGAVFDHLQNAGFELREAHASLFCQDCHVGGQISGLPTDCIGCHQNDFDMVQDPNHVTGQFPENCLQCHNETVWTPAVFNHNNTQFPLQGAHVTTDCIECHADGYTVSIPTDCWSCHETDFNTVNDPNHITNNFDHECTLCHSQSSWTPASFDHANTNFPLTGAHVTLDCIDCHADGYSNIPTDCWSCHENDYNSVTDPNHVTNNFSHDCTDCHNTNDWDEVTFDHANTNFPLTGAHLTVNCIDCHSDGYSNTPTDCWSCHENDYTSVTDPNHVTNNFSHDCTECHNTNDWEEVTFDHANTSFPLTGAHLTVNCIDCHSDGYSNTPINCWSCHENDYNSVADPNHLTNNFNHDCTECHTTAGWTPATFDHSNTNFPITGAHLTLDCIDCHSDGYVNTPKDCFVCHETDFNNTTDPNHQAAQFPTDCENCHNTSNWTQTTWDHDTQYFPIYSGRHDQEWTTCDECHVDPTNYTVFECIFCHEHSNQAQVDDDHSEVQNYVYASWACYDCHPDGEERKIFKLELQRAH